MVQVDRIESKMFDLLSETLSFTFLREETQELKKP